jgi:hypothetical protein
MPHFTSLLNRARISGKTLEVNTSEPQQVVVYGPWLRSSQVPSARSRLPLHKRSYGLKSHEN